MKLLLLFLAFGVLLSVEARKKRPVESEEDIVNDDAPAASDDSEDGGEYEGEAEAEVKSDTGSSCAKSLTYKEQHKLAEARERTCFELLKQIKKQEKKNRRATEKQKEIRDACLEKYTESFLENTYGGFRSSFSRFPSSRLRKAIRKAEYIPCAKEDKIIDFGVGVVRGKY